MINGATLRKMKPGRELIISKAYRKFWDKEAWSVCSRPGGNNSEEDNLEYLLRKAVGMGVPYKCTFITYIHNDEPAARVEVELTPHHKFVTILGYRDMTLKGRTK